MQNEDLDKILRALYKKRNSNYKASGYELLQSLKLTFGHILILKQKGYVQCDESASWKIWLTTKGYQFIVDGGFQVGQDQFDNILGLILFQQKDKFLSIALQRRGLDPLDDVVCKKWTNELNNCAENLMEGINRRVPKHQLKSVLKKSFREFSKLDFEKGDKLLICELFLELASEAGIDFVYEISKWKHGIFIASFLEIKKLIKFIS